jgi:hypothetical protein
MLDLFFHKKRDIDAALRLLRRLLHNQLVSP